MTELGNLSNAVNSILTRLNEIEKALDALRAASDKAEAYMAVASKLAERNHELRTHGRETSGA